VLQISFGDADNEEAIVGPLIGLEPNKLVIR
jgi:hypothetical protein